MHSYKNSLSSLLSVCLSVSFYLYHINTFISWLSVMSPPSAHLFIFSVWNPLMNAMPATRKIRHLLYLWNLQTFTIPTNAMNGMEMTEMPQCLSWQSQKSICKREKGLTATQAHGWKTGASLCRNYIHGHKTRQQLNRTRAQKQ